MLNIGICRGAVASLATLMTCVILHSISVLSILRNGSFCPDFSQAEDNLMIPSRILGDSAFPFEKFLMKLFTNAKLLKEQRYLNYRLSRARMMAEGAYRQLKGR